MKVIFWFSSGRHDESGEGSAATKCSDAATLRSAQKEKKNRKQERNECLVECCCETCPESVSENYFMTRCLDCLLDICKSLLCNSVKSACECTSCDCDCDCNCSNC